MVVEGSVGVRNVKSVMDGMEVFVEKFVHVHSAMEEVLPGVDNEARELCVRRKQVNNFFSTYNPKII